MTRSILYINTPTYTGGAEISLLTLMRNLDPARYAPLLLTSGEGQLTETADQYGIRAITQDFHWFSKRYPWRYPASILRLAAIIRKHRIALVHTNCDHSLCYVMSAARLTQVPYVAHVRDFVRTWFEPHNTVALDRAECVIANSRATAARCLEAGLDSQRVATIYNPVDLTQFRPIPAEKRSAIRAEWGIPNDALVIGIVGQIQPLKGHSEFVKASIKLASYKPDVHFLVVGVCPPGIENQHFLSDLQREVATSAHIKQFHFAGFRQDIAAIMRAIDILAVPSWTEPFGRVAVEGMAAGCAVIATEAGGLLEIIRDGADGLLIQPKDSNALLAAMMRLTQDLPLRQRLANAGPYSAARFAVENHVASIQRLYDGVLGVTPSNPSQTQQI